MPAWQRSQGQGPGSGRPSPPSELEAAAEALALAFADDPCWAHLLREDETRAEKLLAYFTSEIESLVPGLPSGLGHRGRRRRGDLGASRPLAGAAGQDPARGPGDAEGLRPPLPLGLRTLIRLERHHPKSPEPLVPALPRGGTAPPGPRPRRRAAAAGARVLRQRADPRPPRGEHRPQPERSTNATASR